MTRILYLTPLAPLPATDGGRQRTNLLYQALAKLGQVDTVVINKTAHPIDEQERGQLREYYGLSAVLAHRRACERKPWCWVGEVGDRLVHLLRGWGIEYAPEPTVCDYLRDSLGQYDLIVSRYLWTAAVAGVVDGKTPLIIDVDDLESERVGSAMENRGDLRSWSTLRWWWWRRRVSQLVGKERRLLSKSQHFWLTKRQDAERLGELGAWSLLQNISFGMSGTPPVSSSEGRGATILFVGSLAFAPNRHGVERFLEHSWPVIHEAHPEARFRIVGKDAPEGWASLPGVECAGFVPCLEQAYAEAAFSVVPLWEGAGTKIKVLESLQHGRAAVVSRYGLRGYESHLIDGESLLVGDDDGGLAQACIRLLDDPALASRLASKGQVQVYEHYGQGAFERQVREAVEGVLASG